MKESLLRNLASSLQQLTSLRLTIDAQCVPHSRCWNGLGHLRSIPNLKSLRFGFAPFDDTAIQYGTWTSAEGEKLAQRYVSLWGMLGDHTWKSLSRLRSDGLLVCEAGLSEFLGRHAVTLRYLDLFELGLWEGSFEGPLASLKAELSLKKFRLCGEIRGHHTPCDGW
jgi:hypothetical protein